MSYYRNLSCAILILAFLVVGELGLHSLRAVLKGEAQVVANQASAKTNDNQGVAEQEPFPFNSRPILKGQYKNLELRLWVSSASHAADHHGPDHQFANLLCSYLQPDSCYALNASSPGILVEDNIEFLETNGSDWRPEYILLYQAYLDIHHSSRQSGTVADQAPSEAPAANESTVAERVKEYFYVDEWLKRSILRNYSRNYLGSSFLLATPLLSELGGSEKVQYRNRLVSFIESARRVGAKPILITFVSAQGSSEASIPWTYQTWLMRYFEDFSPKTINRSILEYNEIVRNVAAQHGAEVIDLDAHWPAKDRKGQFDDFVHFSKSGHQQVAKIIADELKEIVQ